VFGLLVRVAEPEFFIILELSEQIGRKDWKKYLVFMVKMPRNGKKLGELCIQGA
jgi:hypothetical protein